MVFWSKTDGMCTKLLWVSKDMRNKTKRTGKDKFNIFLLKNKVGVFAMNFWSSKRRDNRRSSSILYTRLDSNFGGRKLFIYYEIGVDLDCCN